MNKYYEEGFNKTAEAYGIEPALLIKAAFTLPGPVKSKALGMFGRYKQLLTGGNKDLLKGYNDMRTTIRAVRDSALNSKDRGTFERMYNLEKELSRAGNYGKGTVRLTTKSPAGKKFVQEFVGNEDVANELGKVFAARALTGAAGLGAIGGAYSYANS